MYFLWDAEVANKCLKHILLQTSMTDYSSLKKNRQM